MEQQEARAAQSSIDARNGIAVQDVIELVKRTKTFVENRERASHIKVKGPADYVTQVDTDIQNFLAKELGRLAPEIQFLGEEEGLHQMTGDTYWILDPIDGTTNLIHDYQHSVVSLGLYDRGEIVMGIVYDPFREDVYHAQKGKGSFLNGKPIQVSEAEKNFRCFQRIFEKSQDIRRTGSAALDLAYVACGRTGGFFEARLSPWDFAAGMLLVTEAGGRVTDYAGGPLNLLKRGSVVASNGKIHEALRALL